MAKFVTIDTRGLSKAFWDSDINPEIPAAAIQIPDEQWREWLTKRNQVRWDSNTKKLLPTTDLAPASESLERHCFLLGAGFSRAYSPAAPVMGDFLQIARASGIYEPDNLHKELATIATRYFGSSIEVNIEKLASLLMINSPSYRGKEVRPIAFEQLSMESHSNRYFVS